MHPASLVVAALTALSALAAALVLLGRGSGWRTVRGTRESWSAMVLLLAGLAVERIASTMVGGLTGTAGYLAAVHFEKKGLERGFIRSRPR